MLIALSVALYGVLRYVLGSLMLYECIESCCESKLIRSLICRLAFLSNMAASLAIRSPKTSEALKCVAHRIMWSPITYADEQEVVQLISALGAVKNACVLQLTDAQVRLLRRGIWDNLNTPNLRQSYTNVELAALRRINDKLSQA